jgi:hypothetical protein
MPISHCGTIALTQLDSQHMCLSCLHEPSRSVAGRQGESGGPTLRYRLQPTGMTFGMKFGRTHTGQSAGRRSRSGAVSRSVAGSSRMVSLVYSTLRHNCTQLA